MKNSQAQNCDCEQESGEFSYERTPISEIIQDIGLDFVDAFIFAFSFSYHCLSQARELMGAKNCSGAGPG